MHFIGALLNCLNAPLFVRRVDLVGRPGAAGRSFSLRAENLGSAVHVG